MIVLQSHTSEPDASEVWSMGIIDQLTSLEGRVNRLRFFLLSVLLIFISAIYGLIFGLIIGVLWAISGTPEIVLSLLIGLVMVPIVYLTYALTLKRLQDISAGGWTGILQAYCLLSILWGMTPEGSWVEIIIIVPLILIGIPLAIVTLFVKGDKGANQFGPDPLGNS